MQKVSGAYSGIFYSAQCHGNALIDYHCYFIVAINFFKMYCLFKRNISLPNKSVRYSFSDPSWERIENIVFCCQYFHQKTCVPDSWDASMRASKFYDYSMIKHAIIHSHNSFSASVSFGLVV